ncbi:MAG: protein jag [Oscillospiraceae bacterium]|jgi:spoIIIJ-associated protein|nr:protein jag [Oscillospiraceae bacterium]
MTAKFIDVTGKTEDEAIRKALSELGLERDEVSVEILERAKKGIFGIGASPAKVRITYGLQDDEPAPPPPPKPAPAPRAPERPAPSKPIPAPKAEKPRQRPERKPASRPRPERQEAEDAVPAVAVQPEALGEPCHDEKAQQISAFLTGLLQHMGSSAQVKVYLGEENRYKVILEGEKLGQLIGRRGETLDAIQQLTNYSVNRGGDKRVRVHVDAENYRLKREQSLQHLACKVAAKVAKYKRNVTLEPMNAYERHVIHTALQNVEGVTTYSMGTEPNRRVIVAYDRGGNKQG